MRRVLLRCTLLAVILVSTPGIATSAEREQLPAGVTPIRYDLALVPAADDLTFGGQVKIAIDIGAPTSAIVLNQDELVLDKAGTRQRPCGGTKVRLTTYTTPDGKIEQFPWTPPVRPFSGCT